MSDCSDGECALCGKELGPSTNTYEHIIPSALGGRRTVHGFICKSCNNNTGSQWDGEVCKDLEPLSLLLQVKRQGGQRRPVKMQTPSGKEYLVYSPERIELPHSSVVPFQEGNREGVHIIARTADEARKIIAKIESRTGRNVSVSPTLEDSAEEVHEIDEPIGFDIAGSGSGFDRSIVKSAVALAFAEGVALESADLALRYLTDSAAAPCFYPYYSDDVICNRIAGTPVNCVQVTADPNDGTVIGYVELYGVVRRIIMLTERYVGEPLSVCYAFDPRSGDALSLDVAISASTFHRAASDYATDVVIGGMRQAADDILRAIVVVP